MSVVIAVAFLALASAAGAEIRCAGHPVEWKVNSRTVKSDQNVLSASRANNDWTVSKQLITRGDGCVSFAATGKLAERVVGMAKTSRVKDLSKLRAGVHLQSSGLFSPIVDGVESQVELPYRRNDRFFIAVSKGVVEFRKNGKKVHSSVISANSPLMLAATLKKAGGKVSSARIASGKCKRWLKNGNCDTAFPTPTPSPEAPVATVPADPTSEPTAVPATPTKPVNSPAPTQTPVATTPAPTKTATPVPTNTSVPTNTFTPVPTKTFTPVPTKTFTPVPTNTFTPAPTRTSTPVPTNAPTQTPTPVPTVGSGIVYYVSTSGSDSNNGMSLSSAWRTVQRAASVAAANSTVYIRAGTYNEIVTINRSNLTFQGYPGDAMPAITSTTGAQTSTVLIGTSAQNVTLRGLDLSGGYYALKFDSNWSNGGGGTGPQRITVDGCKLHDSGSHVIKIQPKGNYIEIKNSEIYRSGRAGLEGQGVDAVNAANLTVKDTYFHDLTHNCLFSKGGAVNTIVERNVMVNCGFGGILLGQDTGTSFMDSASNPNLYECVNCSARNNVIIGTGYAGIGIWSASNTKVYNNTVLNAARIGQGGIFLSKATTGHSGPASINADIRGNIITLASSNRTALSIAAGGFSGTPAMNNNIYYSSGGEVSFIDNRGGGTRSFSAWKTATGQDGSSVEANPNLVAPALYGTNVYPGASSPALNLSPNFSGSGYSDDYFRKSRPSGNWDAGAVQH